MQTFLTLAGRHGPLILFVGVFLGLLLPGLAHTVRPLMAAAVFVFTLGAFLKVERVALEAELSRPARLAGILLWTSCGVPLVTWGLVSVLPLPAGIATGMLLCMLAPPVGSAAAMAAMLRLNPALALTITVLVSLMSPFLLPPAAQWLGGVRLQVDAVGLMLRLAVVVVGAAVAAAALRRVAGAWIRANPHAMTGISVLGLIVVAIGAMHGMRAPLSGRGGFVLAALATAFLLNAGFQLIGRLLFARLGRTDALTVGLISGNRNVTLVWVAAAPWLVDMPDVEVFLAASVFPIFMLPLLTSRLLRHVERGGRQPELRVVVGHDAR